MKESYLFLQKQAEVTFSFFCFVVLSDFFLPSDARNDAQISAIASIDERVELEKSWSFVKIDHNRLRNGYSRWRWCSDDRSIGFRP